MLAKYTIQFTSWLLAPTIFACINGTKIVCNATKIGTKNKNGTKIS